MSTASSAEPRKVRSVPGEGSPPEPVVAGSAATFRPGLFAGRRVLVTAGGTREHLDPVRFLGNRSSGKQGHALARAAVARGAEVVLVTAASLPDVAGARVLRVTSALELRDAVLAEAPAAGRSILKTARTGKGAQAYRDVATALRAKV